MAAKRTSYDRVVSVLRRGPARGLTAATIAERASLNLNTVRNALYTLRGEERLNVVGTVETGQRGRPANLYTLAA